MVLTQFFNTSLAQWKVIEILLIRKQGKSPCEIKSYSLMNLLPILSKLLETIIAIRLKTEILNKKLILNHQFGQNHSTIEQIRLTPITPRFKNSYCNAIFRDVSQAFDRVGIYVCCTN